METNEKRTKAFLLTCYMTGSVRGRNLGTPGYSYDFVAQLFASILEKRGKVIPVENPEFNLEQAAIDARNDGYDPVHISFLPFQDVVMCKAAPNVVVPAWEFPDVPHEEFDGNPRNNWVKMANESDLVIVGGQFTVDSMRRAGTETPIAIVPVPSPQGYFDTPPCEIQKQTTVPCRAFWPRQLAPETRVVATSQTRKECFKHGRKFVSQAIKHFNMAILGPARYQKISSELKRRRIERRKKRATQSTSPDVLNLNYPCTSELQLSGVVYTSIFNPDDGRKNWTDLINAFLIGLGDKPDATLVLKLITRRKEAVEQVIKYYLDRDIPHQCKIAFVVDYLSDETLYQLCKASTYYYQTTRAEGNCLPLMNYLAAGRPGISPNHSAIGDYFDNSIGYVIESDQEPTAWPHDTRLRIRTTWGRLLWTSCRDQLKESYELVTSQPQAYEKLSQRCRSKMSAWASVTAVSEKLDQALAQLDAIHNDKDKPVLYKFNEHREQAVKAARKVA